MAIPSIRVDRKDQARQWNRALQNLYLRCVEAKTDIDSQRLQLVSAGIAAGHYITVTQEVLAAMSVAQLGAIMEDVYSVTWADMSADVTAIYQTDAAALRTAIKAVETDVIRGTVDASGNISLDATLPAQVRTDLIAALDAVINRFV